MCSQEMDLVSSCTGQATYPLNSISIPTYDILRDKSAVHFHINTAYFTQQAYLHLYSMNRKFCTLEMGAAYQFSYWPLAVLLCLSGTESQYMYVIYCHSLNLPTNISSTCLRQDILQNS